MSSFATIPNSNIAAYPPTRQTSWASTLGTSSYTSTPTSANSQKFYDEITRPLGFGLLTTSVMLWAVGTTAWLLAMPFTLPMLLFAVAPLAFAYTTITLYMIAMLALWCCHRHMVHHMLHHMILGIIQDQNNDFKTLALTFALSFEDRAHQRVPWNPIYEAVLQQGVIMHDCTICIITFSIEILGLFLHHETHFPVSRAISLVHTIADYEFKNASLKKTEEKEESDKIMFSQLSDAIRRNIQRMIKYRPMEEAQLIAIKATTRYFLNFLPDARNQLFSANCST